MIDLGINAVQKNCSVSYICPENKGETAKTYATHTLAGKDEVYCKTN